jgi:DNA-binding protein HU-beta
LVPFHIGVATERATASTLAAQTILELWGLRVNKVELVEELARRANLKKSEAERAVGALFDGDGLIASELRRGSRVQITGFGTFQARDRAARTGRDPRTGNAIQIKAAVVPSFKPGQVLKDALNRGG